MGFLQPLPNLGNLPNLTDLSKDLPSLSDVGSAVSSAASGAADAASSAASSISTGAQKALFGVPLVNAVVIILGLLLIAAGIFSFDKTRELVVKAGKTAAEAAAV